VYLYRTTLFFLSVMSGLGFGFTGSYIFSQTIFTYRTGVHSRTIGVLIMIAFLYVVLSPVNLLQLSPLFFYGSTLIFIGYDLLYEWFVEIRERVLLSEYAAIWFTFIAIQIAGVDAGILVGVFFTIIDHVVSTVNQTVRKIRCNAAISLCQPLSALTCTHIAFCDCYNDPHKTHRPSIGSLNGHGQCGHKMKTSCCTRMPITLQLLKSSRSNLPDQFFSARRSVYSLKWPKIWVYVSRTLMHRMLDSAPGNLPCLLHQCIGLHIRRLSRCNERLHLFRNLGSVTASASILPSFVSLTCRRLAPLTLLRHELVSCSLSKCAPKKVQWFVLLERHPALTGCCGPMALHLNRPRRKRSRLVLNQ
jgi:hypothetical protein